MNARENHYNRCSFVCVQEEFVFIKEVMAGDTSAKYKAKRADCEGRIQDNRNTHFNFGSDGEPKHSEQVVFHRPRDGVKVLPYNCTIVLC